MRARHHVRYNPNAGRPYFATQTDKAQALADLDRCVAYYSAYGTRADRTILRLARQRRRKMSGWVVKA